MRSSHGFALPPARGARVRRRRSRSTRWRRWWRCVTSASWRTRSPRPPRWPGSPIDPVCGMTVDTNDAAHTAIHAGTDVLLLLLGLPRAVRRRPGTVPRRNRRLSGRLELGGDHPRRGGVAADGRAETASAGERQAASREPRWRPPANLALDEVVVVLGAHADEIRRSVRLGPCTRRPQSRLRGGYEHLAAGRDRQPREARVPSSRHPRRSAGHHRGGGRPPAGRPGGFGAPRGGAELRRAPPSAGGARSRAAGGRSTRSRETSGCRALVRAHPELRGRGGCRHGPERHPIDIDTREDFERLAADPA